MQRCRRDRRAALSSGGGAGADNRKPTALRGSPRSSSGTAVPGRRSSTAEHSKCRQERGPRRVAAVGARPRAGSAEPRQVPQERRKAEGGHRVEPDGRLAADAVASLHVRLEPVRQDGTCAAGGSPTAELLACRGRPHRGSPRAAGRGGLRRDDRPRSATAARGRGSEPRARRSER